jgi:hypothetical protein
MLEQSRKAVFPLTAGVLVAWMAISGLLQHPDYLSYFNRFAGNKPETILVDSNYDWGQDLKLVAKRLHELGATEVSLATMDGVGASLPERYEILEAWYGLPRAKLAGICTPSPGWNVLGTTVEQGFSRWPGSIYYRGSETAKPWFEQISPNERVGGMLLYKIPPGMHLSVENCH